MLYLLYSNNNYGLEFQTAITTNLIKENYRIRYFSELVLYFKHLFHIRSDNSLKKILENTNNSENWNQIIDISFSESQFPENIEFFTNIEKLIQAYKVLINLIIDVANKNNLERPLVELKLIEKKFYKHLADIFLEGNKAVNLSDSETVKRYKILTLDAPNQPFKEGKASLFVGSHINNWEYGALGCGLQVDPLVIVFYNPIKNDAGDVSKSFVEFKTRIKPTVKADLAGGINLQKDVAKYSLVVIAHIIGVTVRELDKFESEDYDVISQLATVFM
jgi:hypothetical protein